MFKINHNNALGSFIAILVLVLHLAGCTPSNTLHAPQLKDDKLYGVTSGAFRHKWWNYYERALSFADGGFWQEAESDLRSAFRLRDEDKRRARTYGMAFIEYFPHRELGIVLFQQGRLQEAIQELESSLRTERSAKAEYYLDKSRKVWLVSSSHDLESPSIMLEDPPVSFRTNQATIIIKGTVTDDYFVSEVRVNGKKMRLDLASPIVPFRMEIPILHGENTLTIEARDLSGKSTVLDRVVIGDRAGPILNLDELKLAEGEGDKILVQGYAYDSSLVSKISINGKNILTNPIAETRIKHVVLHKELDSPVIVVAEDSVGNRTTAEIIYHRKAISTNHAFKNFMLASSDSALSYLLLASAEEVSNRSSDYVDNISLKKSANDYALIIGIDQYEEWTPLETAVNDAKALGEILVRKYGYSKTNVNYIIDKDATRSNIILTLRTIASRLGEKDNLLIYFAGHGQLDDLTDDGYWIPYNGKLDAPFTWVTHSTIKTILSSERVRGKNIVVVADSCYSGNLLRGGQNISLTSDEFYLRRLTELSRQKSRQVISSGGIEPVADGGRDNHSLFAYYFLKALEQNTLPMVDLENIIISKVWQSVSKKGGQRPTVGRLKTPMDEDGQFVLVLNKSTTTNSMPPSNVIRTIPSAMDKVDRSLDWLPDSKPPLIEIKGWQDEQSVFQAEVLFEGKVFDENGVQNFTINGQNILRRPGKNIFYNFLAELKEGENLFLFKVVDQVGNTTERRIEITRRTKSVLATGSRMSTALYLQQHMDQQLSELVDDLIVKYMLESNRFDLKDPGWSLALQDSSGLGQNIRDDDLLDAARSMEVDFVVLGKAIARNDTLQISARVIETATSLIVAFEDIFGENIDQMLINDLSKGLIVKLRDALPLVEGYIVKKNDNNIIVNLGKEHGIKKGMHLTFYEEKEPLVDPVTGAILEMDIEELAEARVKKVKEKVSLVELLDNGVSPRLRVGHQVVMQ